jgi:hypothetical protein
MADRFSGSTGPREHQAQKPAPLTRDQVMMAAEVGAGFMPGIGDALSIRDAYRAGRGALDDFGKGDYIAGGLGVGEAALGGLGALPFVPNLAGIFIGKKGAANIPGALEKAEKAKSMQKSGGDPSEIHAKTGWFEGEDGEWRMEIDDSKAKMTNASTDYYRPMPLRDAIDHPELFQAYPDAGDMSYTFAPGEKPATGHGMTGAYSAAHNAMMINTPMETPLAAHEIQHWIQNRENFPLGSRGAKFKGDMEAYRNNLGEIEAHDVTKRVRDNRDPPALLTNAIKKKGKR